jgi:DNA-binding PadR family transcriptional regulator
MALLALLDEGPRYGYQLRTEFQERTGGTWPLNVGQVYTTLGRLVRDRLAQVEADHVGEDTRLYRITSEGHLRVAGWFASPVAREVAPREELAIKLALALSSPGVDVRDVIQRQRSETVRALLALTRDKRAIPAADIARRIVVESQITQTEAEARWLDISESMLLQHRAAAGLPSDAPTPSGGQT